MSEKKAFSRLPTDVRPLNYVISLKPDLDKFTFVGNEDVTIEVLNPDGFFFFGGGF